VVLVVLTLVDFIGGSNSQALDTRSAGGRCRGNTKQLLCIPCSSYA